MNVLLSFIMGCKLSPIGAIIRFTCSRETVYTLGWLINPLYIQIIYRHSLYVAPKAK